MKFLREWEAGSGQLRALIAGAEKGLSPRLLLEMQPLARLPDEDRLWLGALLHALWKWRYPIDAVVERAARSLLAADQAYERLLALWRRQNRPRQYPPCVANSMRLLPTATS